MLKIDIAEFGKYDLEHAVFDYNGTLAKDGVPENNVVQKLLQLNNLLQVHILTADTFGRVSQALGKYSFKIKILSPGNESLQKKEFVENLNSATVVAFGNGRNDIDMLKISALGIGVIGREGMNAKVMQNADIIVKNINDGIELLFNPLRIKATLRS